MSPPLALHRTAGHPDPRLHTQARVHFFRPEHNSLPAALSGATRSSPSQSFSKETLAFQKQISPEGSGSRSDLNIIDIRLIHGSSTLPSHIPSGKLWKYSLEEREKEVLRTFSSDPGLAADLVPSFFSRLSTLQLQRPAAWVQIPAPQPPIV